MARERTYEVTGVMLYADCVCAEVTARNKKEAMEKAREIWTRSLNPTDAEFAQCVIDTPTEIKPESNA